tara:strand:- start:437 stop:2140 length:1704 start_codon:yes stop_codon:yes gene_type:complete
MRRIFVVLCLICCVFSPSTIAQTEENYSWEIDLDNGYISTKPIFLEEQVIVRTSGFWTGEDRPHVYAFDLQTGQENWKFKNSGSTNHDMSPLLHVKAGSGDCGSWDEMIIVGWTDGKVTALDVSNGSLIWSSQTEVVTWGITGKMSQDGENVVVPTRQGLSRFCLSDGLENLRVDLPQLGWRNGVTVTNDSYLLGNEEGVLNIISKSGNVSNITIGDGMIRHAPVSTQTGIVIHLQTNNGSEIYLDNQLLAQEGYSPAIPLYLNGDIFFSTSDSVIRWNCEISCEFKGRTAFHSNGEITAQPTGNNTTIWFPRNTPDGGWGYGLPGEEIEMYHTAYDTYTTAGVGFGPNGEMAFGNDAGVLIVVVTEDGQNQSHEIVVVTEDEQNQSHEINKESDSQSNNGFQVRPVHFVIAGIIVAMIVSFNKGNRDLMAKYGVLLLLVTAIMVFPAISQSWSQEVSEMNETPGDWDDDWPDEWKDTQVVVFELPDGELVIGGLSGHENVEQLTDSAANQLGIEVGKESFSLGEMIVSFDGHELDGWEFTIDGKRSQVGISAAEVSEDSVIRWSAA